MVHPASDEAWVKDSEPAIVSGSRQNDASSPSGYKVGFPPKRKLVTQFTDRLKETFLGDDPLRPYKDQPRSRKFVLGLQYLFPIFDWGRNYNLKKFKGDAISGLTIASLCIPQDIGYSKLAYLDPQFGLYSSFVPPLVYAVMGSSRDIAIGPVAVVSLLLGTLLQNEFDPVKEKLQYERLAFTATFFAGITQATLGFFRLGFLIDFLSHAAIVGFMAGAAITIALQQLKGFLGIKNFTKETDIISVMKSVWGSVHHGWNWQTILIGSSFLAFLLFAKYIGKKKKKLFWIPAIAPLISVILSTFFVYITRADKDGVAIVQHIEKGINPSSLHKIFFDGPNVVKGFKIGAVAGMIGLTEAIAIGRTFAGMKDYQLDGNKEMLALGTMNVVGSMTSCYVATGSFSRSAVNYMAGCQTAVSNIVMSLIVLLTLEVITPLFKYTPNAILSSIIISAVIGLIDYEAALLIWKIDKLDFIACMGAFFGVVFKSVEIGLLIAVAISLAKILLQVTRPRTALLGNLPGTTIYRNTEQYPEATKVPGILVVRVDSAIYFSNSNYVKERILRWLRDEEDQLKENNLPKIEHLIVEMSPVIDIDTSGIHALEELYKSLAKHDIKLVLANPGPVVMEKLQSSKFTELIGQDNIFLTVGEAVMTLAPKSREEA
ncbi:LOW QUALITY PROTEIN: sulfate transporter 1.2-like [Dioscorea cayenensis subsp. rotundata]|uniref:LOW QUALITY PROTEIN: sulfate transporter 1.2-like n=1 Tax=Dioscorea cayennensis subsp. rotundata TaxID=55577 RepID=A0AB40BEE8_DIOCR|nr:LOW QUALITY PROTEIN: sulfate transporter 1.2-like [Dioscorea cayenensis subsp. rotundata]